MTNEKLYEIEKLAREATQARALDVDDLVELRDQVLPLVNALRDSQAKVAYLENHLKETRAHWRTLMEEHHEEYERDVEEVKSDRMGMERLAFGYGFVQALRGAIRVVEGCDQFADGYDKRTLIDALMSIPQSLSSRQLEIIAEEATEGVYEWVRAAVK